MTEKCNGYHCRCMDIGGQCEHMHWYHCKDPNPGAYAKGGPHGAVNLPQKQEHALEKGEWKEKLNSVLFRNITASGDLNKMRPMKVGLVDELKDFIRTLIASECAEAEQRGRDRAVGYIGSEWEDNMAYSNSEIMAILEAARTHKGTKEEI